MFESYIFWLSYFMNKGENINSGYFEILGFVVNLFVNTGEMISSKKFFSATSN